MNSEIDYTSLPIEKLKDLVNQNDPKADEEYDRRVRLGEIKLRRVTIEDIKEMYRKNRAS